MDEEEVRRAYAGLIADKCPFEKAILCRHGGCSRAAKVNLAEREAIDCQDRDGLKRCRGFIQSLTAQAHFALGRPELPTMLPHAQAIRIQVGGLTGINQALGNQLTALEDIDGLLDQAQQAYGDLDHWPYDRVMRGVVSFKGRTRHRKKR